MIKLTSPLFVMLPRKTMKDKKVHLNFNTMKNQHYLVYNQAKQLYKAEMAEQLKGVKFEKPIDIKYTFYKGSNRRVDRNNFIFIIDKFFCDALTELGCIPDDNDDFIHCTHNYSGGLDRENPRVDIEIIERKAI